MRRSAGDHLQKVRTHDEAESLEGRHSGREIVQTILYKVIRATAYPPAAVGRRVAERSIYRCKDTEMELPRRAFDSGRRIEEVENAVAAA